MKGTGAVGGISMGKIFVIDESIPEIVKSFVEDTEKENQRFCETAMTASKQIEKLMKAAVDKLGKENAEVFDYQLLLLEDNEFLGQIQEMIKVEHVNSEYAVSVVSQKYIKLFENIDNEYLRERTTDLSDLAKRLIFLLRGKEIKTFSDLDENSIIVGVDLTPSQAADINKEKVKGIVLEKGGKSSHSVIIARSMAIPCIVGVDQVTEKVIHGAIAMINGDTGEIFISPSNEQINEFKAYENKRIKEKRMLDGYIHCESKTIDGFETKIFANITSENETEALDQHGGEGVGLFRTEFLYMQSKSAPSEEYQCKVYSNVAQALGKRPLIIRTLDVGGDKEISCLKMPKEQNPFLGYRAIRYCLGNPEIFKTQVAAILRSGLHGNVKLMLPMIASITELRCAKQIIGEVKSELYRKGTEFADDLQLGIMVETPAAALMADTFAKEVDFFSIGTNDLTQYLFAADRMNEKTAYLNSYFHPALLHTVKHVCESAAKYGIEVDICGQAGESPEMVPMWVAMGVNNLSVSIPSIPGTRKIITKLKKSEAVELLAEVLNLDTAEEVQSRLKEQSDRLRREI